MIERTSPKVLRYFFCQDLFITSTEFTNSHRSTRKRILRLHRTEMLAL